MSRLEKHELGIALLYVPSPWEHSFTTLAVGQLGVGPLVSVPRIQLVLYVCTFVFYHLLCTKYMSPVSPIFHIV